MHYRATSPRGWCTTLTSLQCTHLKRKWNRGGERIKKAGTAKDTQAAKKNGRSNIMKRKKRLKKTTKMAKEIDEGSFWSVTITRTGTGVRESFE